MSRSKAKSNYKISLPEAILNLSKINYKSKNIARCLIMAFAKKIEQKYVVKVIQNNKRRLKRNVFMFDRRKQRKISDTAIHLIKRLNDLSNGLITGKQLQKKLKQYLNLDVSESRYLHYSHKIIGTNFRRSRFQPKMYNQYEKNYRLAVAHLIKRLGVDRCQLIHLKKKLLKKVFITIFY